MLIRWMTAVDSNILIGVWCVYTGQGCYLKNQPMAHGWRERELRSAGATPLLTARCVYRLQRMNREQNCERTNEQNSKPAQFLLAQQAALARTSPVGDDELNRAALAAVSLDQRALHDVDVESHAPDCSEFLLLHNEMQQNTKAARARSDWEGSARMTECSSTFPKSMHRTRLNFALPLHHLLETFWSRARSPHSPRPIRPTLRWDSQEANRSLCIRNQTKIGSTCAVGFKAACCDARGDKPV
jgi:hypothetical protein